MSLCLDDLGFVFDDNSIAALEDTSIATLSESISGGIAVTVLPIPIMTMVVVALHSQ